LPRFAATLGNQGRKGSNPIGGCVGSAAFAAHNGNRLQANETNYSVRKRHNPFGVETVRHFFPRVAAKRGNPGLCDVTASRYLSRENLDLFRASLSLVVFQGNPAWGARRVIV